LFSPSTLILFATLDPHRGFIDRLGFIEIGDDSLCAIVSLKEIEMSSQ
jgi:hypothetical protein